MKKVKHLLPIIPLLLLSGCTGGGGGFNLPALVQNPVVMVLIFIVVLWLLFKGGKK